MMKRFVLFALASTCLMANVSGMTEGQEALLSRTPESFQAECDGIEKQIGEYRRSRDVLFGEMKVWGSRAGGKEISDQLAATITKINEMIGEAGSRKQALGLMIRYQNRVAAAAAPAPAAAAPAAADERVKVCNACTFINPVAESVCETCRGGDFGSPKSIESAVLETRSIRRK